MIIVSHLPDKSPFFPMFVYRAMHYCFCEAKFHIFVVKDIFDLEIFQEILNLPEANFESGKYPKNEEILYVGTIEGKGKFLTRKLKNYGTPCKYVVSLWKNVQDADYLRKVGALGFMNEEEIKLHGNHDFGEMPYLRCQELEPFFSE